MFPNVRLMIAAIFVSVVALGGGFGVFAAFRVNHEPLVRLQAATAPLQLAADHTAALPMRVAAAEPLFHLSGFTAPHAEGGPMDAQVRELDAHDIEAPRATAIAPQPGVATTAKTAATAQPPAATSTAAQQSEEAAVKPVAPLADNPAVGASKPAQPATTGAAESTSSPSATTGSAAPPPPQQAKVPEADREAKPKEAAEPTGGPAPAAPPRVATVASPTDQIPAAEQTTPAIEPAPASLVREDAKATPKTAGKVAVKKIAAKKTAATKTRTRVAARMHRARKRRATAVAQSDSQNFGFGQPGFQTAPQSFQPRQVLRVVQAQARPARVHRSKIASKKPPRTTSAVGGPFVSWTDRQVGTRD